MKISIVDYIGHCDELKKPTGHSLKTLNDFVNCLEEHYEIELTIPQIYMPYIKNQHRKIGIDNYRTAKLKGFSKIIHIFNTILTISNILKNTEKELLWFLNTDFWLFFTLAIMKVDKRRIFVTNYLNYEVENNRFGFIKSKIYKAALKKIECVFTSNQMESREKHIFIPDYYYDNKHYENYISDKTYEVVCLGDMNTGKDIDGLIDAFNQNGIKLLIAGRFYSEDFYKNIVNKAKSNIEIKNIYLQEKEYFSILGKAKFCILPYKQQNYLKRSSGILLEACFLNTVIIAPRFLLEHNRIFGIGYDNLNEINRSKIMEFNQIEIEKILEANSQKKCQYEKDSIRAKLINAFDKNN